MRYIAYVALLVMACQPLATESHPDNPLERYATEPLDISFDAFYREWWSDMEQCSGLRGNLGAIRWFTLADPDLHTFSTMFGDAVGMWIPSENAILLTQWRISSEPTVKHEMLHALIGHGGHGPEFDWCGVRNGSHD